MPATSRKRPAFSPLNDEARQPTGSVGSISPLRAWRRLAVGLYPPTMTMGSCFFGREGVIAREIVASRVLRPRLQKGRRISGTLRYYTGHRKRWTSNLSWYSLIARCTYPSNETLVHQQLLLHQLHLTATPKAIFFLYMMSCIQYTYVWNYCYVYWVHYRTSG